MAKQRWERGQSPSSAAEWEGLKCATCQSQIRCQVAASNNTVSLHASVSLCSLVALNSNGFLQKETFSRTCWQSKFETSPNHLLYIVCMIDSGVDVTSNP